MISLLLVIIYTAFISLGLPDGLLGSAWPSISGQLNVPVAFAGVVSMIIAGGTIVSSLCSDRLIRRLGTGVTTFLSVATTALALFGFSWSAEFWQLCLWAIPYGLGAGSVDAALNNYVALHYSSRHMSWLHCFWGVGASLGPYIMGSCLTRNLPWTSGYREVGYIQIVLSVVLLACLPLWGEKREKQASGKSKTAHLGLKQTLALPGAKPAFIAFCCYCGLETTVGLWASSYLVLHRGMTATVAAKYASLFYLGITIGRFFCGFISNRMGDRKMVRFGQSLITIGILLLFIPRASLVSFVTIGLGCAPVYPSLLHATPRHFGAANSQSIMGIQMASAYVGSTFLPPVFGFLAGKTTIALLPWYLACFLVLMFVCTELLEAKAGRSFLDE